MSKKISLLTAALLIPTLSGAFPVLIFDGNDFSGKLEFASELPTQQGLYGYYQSDNIANWEINYTNGEVINPLNTASSPGYRNDGKYVGLGFNIDGFGALSYLEFYVANTSGTYFDLEINSDSSGNLYEHYGRASIALLPTPVPEPSTLALLAAAVMGALLARANRKVIQIQP